MDNVNSILRPIPDDLFSLCSRRDLLGLLHGEQSIRLQLQLENDRLRAEKQALEEQVLNIEGQYVRIKNKIFGKSSEKTTDSEPAEDPHPRAGKEDEDPPKKNGEKPPRKLSDRYPHALIEEKELGLETPPTCRSCGHQMSESGMFEVSEQLTVIPKKYIIERHYRQKYRCQCHGDIQTTPCLSRIKPGSAYSDAMIIDIACSKYCDLIPIERYSAMASRQGFEGLPPNSLIEATHNLADFIGVVVEQIRQEVLSLRVLYADETRHRMLEGDTKSNWYFWGFSGEKACYFECHDTRSGNVAGEFLIQSRCTKLLSDVFSGYRKAVKDANIKRSEMLLPLIENAFCNAHSRRKFKEASERFYHPTQFYLKKYREIYKIDSEVRGKSAEDILNKRQEMVAIFSEMKLKAESELDSYSTKSSMFSALGYFLKNFEGLTLFLVDPEIPIDNNSQERTLRNPVIGRKTWYGTHSRRGAETAAKLFTVVETCKLNKVNPRAYLQKLVQTLHSGAPPFTPREYNERISVQ